MNIRQFCCFKQFCMVFVWCWHCSRSLSPFHPLLQTHIWYTCISTPSSTSRNCCHSQFAHSILFHWTDISSATWTKITFIRVSGVKARQMPIRCFNTTTTTTKKLCSFKWKLCLHFPDFSISINRIISFAKAYANNQRSSVYVFCEWKCHWQDYATFK